MNAKKDIVSLNDINVATWKTLCNKLEVTDDGLFKVLLTAYQSHCSQSALQKNSAAILQQLNRQRQACTHQCDFHYQIYECDEVSIMSAHTYVLKACLGVGFGQFLTFPQTTSGISVKGGFSAIQQNDKTIFQVPRSFQNVVQYCYTGSFYREDENVPNIPELKKLVQLLFDNPEVDVMINTGTDFKKPKNTEKVAPTSNKVKQIISSKVTRKKRKESSCHTVNKKQFLKKVKQSSLTKVARKTEEAPSHVSLEDKEYEQFTSDSDVSAKDSNEYILSEDQSEIDYVINEDVSSKDNIEKLYDKASPNPIKPCTSFYQCTECKKMFRTRAELAKHFRKDHLKSLSKQNPTKKFSKHKAIAKISSKSKKVKIDSSIGSCCNQDFFSKFRFGVHILHNHSTVYVNCSECEDLVLLQDLIPHYQTRHDYPSFLLSQSHLSFTESEQFKGDNFNVREFEKSSTNTPALPDVFSTTMSSGIDKLNSGENTQKFWEKEIKCFGCQKEMSVRCYVDHVTEQYERAQLNNLQCCTETLYKNHRCLYIQCLLCKSANLAVGMKPVRPYLLLMNHIRHYHLADSTKDEKVRCDTCGNLIMKYYIEEHQKRHITTIKRRSQKVTCDICGKEVVKNRFSTHHRSHIERYPCRHCSKVFNRRENMLVHERIHTGEKPFVCDICGKGFRQKVELRLHGRKHEKEDAALSKSQETNSILIENGYYF